ncbi:MAG: rod shape-determining protein MreD [Nitriliruptorales bacterium]|nr:rod shape-determining protein MreD [Nitriliruptorales bacterium]
MSARLLALGVVLLTALLLQSVVTPMIAIGGWGPDIVLAAVVAFALIDGAETGARFGFVAGLGSDLLSGGPHLVGLMALVFLLVGEGAGRLRPYLSGSEPVTAVAVSAVAGIVAFGLFGGMSLLLDIRSFTFLLIVQGALASAAWTAVTVPLAMVPVRAISRRFTGGETAATGSSVAGRQW